MLAIDPGTSIVNTGISTLLKVGNLTKAHFVIIQKHSNAKFKWQFKVESISYGKIPLIQKPLKQVQFSKPKHPQSPQHMPSTPTKNLFKIQNLSSCGHFIKQVADSNQQNHKHYFKQWFEPSLFPLWLH